MKLIPMKIEYLGAFDLPSENDVLTFIGRCAGEAYNSKMDREACMNRALNIIKRGHHSPYEHMNITLKCTVDRGTSHALVRHRHCAFTQSSTIYQKFQECEFIDEVNEKQDANIDEIKVDAYEYAETLYHDLLDAGEAPSSARDVLPNDLATNVVITTNLRQWMYMLQRRCGPGDSDKMHKWCKLTRYWFEEHYPRITLAFDTWYDKHPL